MINVHANAHDRIVGSRCHIPWQACWGYAFRFCTPGMRSGISTICCPRGSMKTDTTYSECVAEWSNNCPKLKALTIQAFSRHAIGFVSLQDYWEWCLHQTLLKPCVFFYCFGAYCSRSRLVFSSFEESPFLDMSTLILQGIIPCSYIFHWWFLLSSDRIFVGTFSKLPIQIFHIHDMFQRI